MMGGCGDGAADPARAAARARLAARAAHVDGGMAAQAAAEAAVEAVNGVDGDDENPGSNPRRSVFSRLQRGTPSQLALGGDSCTRPIQCLTHSLKPHGLFNH
jgi:hypothetical protein